MRHSINLPNNSSTRFFNILGTMLVISTVNKTEMPPLHGTWTCGGRWSLLLGGLIQPPFSGRKSEKEKVAMTRKGREVQTEKNTKIMTQKWMTLVNIR